MKKTSTVLGLLLLTTSLHAQNMPSFHMPSMQETIDEIFVKADDKKSLEDFIEYKKVAAEKYPHLTYVIYEGKSKFNTVAGAPMGCYSLIGLDQKSKKIRDFRIVSNIKTGLVSSDSKLMKTTKKLFGKVSSKVVGSGDLEIDAENEKNDTQNIYWGLSSKYETILPKNFEEDKQMRENMELYGMSGAHAYFKFNYKEKASLLNENSSTSVEAGIDAVLFNYKVVNIKLLFDKKEKPVELIFDGGLGFGHSLQMDCQDLKPMAEVAIAKEDAKVEEKEEIKEENKEETATEQ